MNNKRDLEELEEAADDAPPAKKLKQISPEKNTNNDSDSADINKKEKENLKMKENSNDNGALTAHSQTKTQTAKWGTKKREEPNGMNVKKDCGNVSKEEYMRADVNFGEIRANGEPYQCPFNKDFTLLTWYDWKRHWYNKHDKDYFAAKTKTRSNDNEKNENEKTCLRMMVHSGQDAKKDCGYVSPQMMQQIGDIVFTEIKQQGSPYLCPFHSQFALQTWSDWKAHWYARHDKQYFSVKLLPST